jgi:hypothetical protein
MLLTSKPVPLLARLKVVLSARLELVLLERLELARQSLQETKVQKIPPPTPITIIVGKLFPKRGKLYQFYLHTYIHTYVNDALEKDWQRELMPSRK